MAAFIEKLLGVPKVDISLQFDDGKEVVKKEKEKENWREKTQEGRETVLVPYGGTPEDLFIYFGAEKVSGTVILSSDAPVPVNGVNIELIGCVALAFGDTTNFTAQQKELEEESFILQNTPKKYVFSFENVPKPHESYKGAHVTVRYFLKVSVLSKKDYKKEFNFWVRNTQIPPSEPGRIKMDIGVQDHLHIEFTCEQNWYHTRDVIVGKIYFALVRLKLFGMQMSIIKEETTYRKDGEKVVKPTTILETELMDGAPVKGEVIPVRVFLERYKLTPTYSSVCKKFDVRYYLKLVLADEKKRHFFKKCEIFIWRKN